MHCDCIVLIVLYFKMCLSVSSLCSSGVWASLHLGRDREWVCLGAHPKLCRAGTWSLAGHQRERSSNIFPRWSLSTPELFNFSFKQFSNLGNFKTLTLLDNLEWKQLWFIVPIKPFLLQVEVWCGGRTQRCRTQTGRHRLFLCCLQTPASGSKATVVCGNRAPAGIALMESSVKGHAVRTQYTFNNT